MILCILTPICSKDLRFFGNKLQNILPPPSSSQLLHYGRTFLQKRPTPFDKLRERRSTFDRQVTTSVILLKSQCLWRTSHSILSEAKIECTKLSSRNSDPSESRPSGLPRAELPFPKGVTRDSGSASQQTQENLAR